MSESPILPKEPSNAIKAPSAKRLADDDALRSSAQNADSDLQVTVGVLIPEHPVGFLTDSP